MKQKEGGDTKEILLRMKNGYTFENKLVESKYAFRIINKKARNEEMNCYWYNCLLNDNLKVDTQFLSGEKGGLCSQTACCLGTQRRWLYPS